MASSHPPAPFARRRQLLLAAAGLLVAALALPASGAAAGKAKTTVDRLAGQVILSPKEFPPSFSSDDAFYRTMNQMKTGAFRADPKGGWQINFLAFFPLELDELSCEVHVFDVTDKATGGKSKHIETYNQFLARRGQRTLASSLWLDPDRFEKDHTYRMIVAHGSDRGLLAEARFVLLAAP